MPSEASDKARDEDTSQDTVERTRHDRWRAPAGGTEASVRSPFRAIEPNRTRLADEVYRQVLDAVLNGTLKPGQRIVQDRLASEINISRTPVREALLHLEREGVLARVGAAGFTIREIGEREVRDIYQAREAIEGYAARIVAERRNAASLKRIERTVEKEQSMAVGGVGEYFDANRRIHRSIVDETGNEYLLRSFDALWNRALSFRIFATIQAVDLSASLREHETLVASMRDDPPNEAAEAMIAHIREGLALQLRALSEPSGADG